MSQATTWNELQDALADLPGEDGCDRRSAAYAPFFLRFGAGVRIHAGCRFFHPERIVLDDDVRFNLGTLVYGSGGVWIGRHARIGPRCFIHSANHDIGAGDNAYFERGYVERPVRIGDNVLISANVSIMPGARIGSGVFVAAGAVVPGKSFADETRLMGAPARASHPETVAIAEAPELAILVPQDGHWRDAARHLRASLGLPQLCVLDPGETWPQSVRSVLVIGPEGFRPELHKRTGWHLGELDDPAAGAAAEAPIATVCARAERGSPDAAAASLFWCLVRLGKGDGALAPIDLVEWLWALRLMKLPLDRKDRLSQRIVAMLQSRAPAWLDPGILAGLSEADSAASWDAHLARACRDLPAALAAARPPADMLLARAAAAAFGSPPAGLAAELRSRLAKTGATRDLLAIWCAGAALGMAELTTACEPMLADPALWPSGVAFPYARRGRPALFYSPLVPAWHLLRSGQTMLPEGAGTAVCRFRAIASAGPARHYDSTARVVARSLLADWLTLHEAPCPPGHQFLLEHANYRPILAQIEAAWIAVFRAIQTAAGRPLVRLVPWPAPSRAALALRYDVDRPIEPVAIRRIARIQREWLGGPAASWYFFADAGPDALDQTLLARHWQEVGLHATAAAQATAAVGVTHHSAPNSDYWEGDRTLARLDAAGSAYGEFLAAQIYTPRPAWLASPGRIGAPWITPVHFPLEGSTSDTTLDHFDRLRSEFRAVIAGGGLAIVASHPDLDQAKLVKLLRRENLAEVWPTTVNGAVERCRLVCGDGAIRTVAGDDPAEIGLVARRHVADLSLEVYLPGEEAPRRLTTQLLANRPRRIPLPGGGTGAAPAGPAV